jgi:hypothetical protein
MELDARMLTVLQNLILSVLLGQVVQVTLVREFLSAWITLYG